MTHNYDDYRPLLKKLVYNFRRRFGGEMDELLSDATERFYKACESYKPTVKGREIKFITWLHQVVWWGMLDKYKAEIKRKGRFNELENPDGLPYRRKQFCFRAFMLDISDDAKAVVRTTLKLMQNRPRVIGEKPKKQIIRYLLKDGWSGDRIIRSFNEIKEMLT